MELQERKTGLLVVTIIDNEIDQVFEHEENMSFNSGISRIFTDTKDNLLIILGALGITDTSKLDEF